MHWSLVKAILSTSIIQGLDVGPKSREEFAQVISTAKTVIWNG